ncbi:MAG: HD domain-containing protein [Sedimentisphaerales bacterium]|jgi:HD superfamily phosphohydrolase
MDYKRFRIPFRDVKLTESEVAITQTRTFQRLFYLKQLGLVYLVYPCATHTRAGHSIECLDEANNLLASIGLREGSDWEEVRIAALLHDIGHVPFSHTLEDENLVLPNHDKKERVMQVLEKIKSEVDNQTRSMIERATPILLAISSTDERQRDWRSDLVGNTVCADLLAYIKTDAAWTGIEKVAGYYRVYEYFKLEEKPLGDQTSKKRLCICLTKGGLRTDIVSSIIDLLDMRYALTERVIFHHAKAIASAMLARITRLVNLQYSSELLDMGDEVFLDHLDHLIAKHGDNESKNGAKMLLDHLRCRQLYKRVFKIQRQAMEEWDRNNSKTDNDTFSVLWRDPYRIEQLLLKIEARVKLPRGSLVLWCPEAQSGMKLAKVNVIWEQSSGGWHSPVELRSAELKQQFPGVHERVDTIEKQYLDLWKFWVGLCPEQIDKTQDVINALEDELNIKCDSVFIETYLKKRLPGYKDRAKLDNKVEILWRTEYKQDVADSIMNIAARDNKKPINPVTINEAIHMVSEEKRSLALKKYDEEHSGQLDLFKSAQSQKPREDNLKK